ncbi:MAG: cysteine dioxygenase family protein [Xanthomonadales bacterium]|nr:cysteine dioxygenase family protein [Xanthomonadales bacterium]
MRTTDPTPLPADAGWLAAARERLGRLPRTALGHDIEALRDALSDLPWLPGCPDAARLARHDRGQRYRRHLIGGSAVHGWTALLIAWPPGHRTPLHDHDGLWGIELVLEGALAIEEFRKNDHDGEASLEHERTLILGIGDATAFTHEDYVHACRNLSAQRPALSLHVYGGVLDGYSTFHTGTLGRATPTRRRAGIDAVMI